MLLDVKSVKIKMEMFIVLHKKSTFVKNVTMSIIKTKSPQNMTGK